MREEHVIYRTVTGSTAYGLDREGSDIDKKGVYLPSIEKLLSLGGVEETIVQHEPDLEYHVLEKYMKLLYKQNPTILETLATDVRFVDKCSEEMEDLRGKLDMFLSKKVYWSFSGYAKDQLVRIKNGQRGLSKEEIEDHGLHVVNTLLRRMGESGSVLTNRKFSIDKGYVAHNGVFKMDVSVHVDKVDFTELNNYFNEVNTTMKNLNKTKNRNRRASDEKLEKHAMHLIRLLKMGIEILKGEGVQVYRKNDRVELLSIRNGEWDWEDVFRYAEELFSEMESVQRVSKLRDEVSWASVESLYSEMLSRSLKV